VTATGTPTLAYAVSGGVLPPGLALDAVTGAITGTPTEAGSWDIEFTVTNPYGTDTGTYTLVVDPPAGTAPTITSGPTATSTVGVSYVSSVTAMGSPELVFEVTTGELPPGLSMDPATGIITGSPTEAGTWEFVVTVSNEFGSDTGEYTIVSSAVAPTPTPTPGPNDDHSSLAFTGSGPTMVPLFVGGGLVLVGAAAIGATLIARRRATVR
jgi:PKD repeat protein